MGVIIIDVIGYLAGVLGLISLIPQIAKSLKTKSTGDLSFGMYLIYSISVVLWLVYGYLLGSMPMMVINSILFILCLIIIYLEIKYGSKF